MFVCLCLFLQTYMYIRDGPRIYRWGDNEVCMEAKPLSGVQERIEPLVGCQGEAPLELKIFQ